MRFSKLSFCILSLLLVGGDALAGRSASFSSRSSFGGGGIRLQSSAPRSGSISVAPLGPSRGVSINPNLTQKSPTGSSLKSEGNRPVDTGSLYRKYKGGSNPPPPAYNPWDQPSGGASRAGGNRGPLDSNYAIPQAGQPAGQRRQGFGLGHVLAGAAAGALLTHMLESTAQANDFEQYRRHYNDPDVAASRRTQMEAARNNPELRQKLEALDTRMKTPVGKLCAGLPQGAYAKVAATLSQAVPVETVTTTGSVENVARVTDGRCDLGFSQRDVLAAQTGQAMKTASDFMLETLFLMCRKDKLPASLAKLPAGTRVAVPRESGASATWDILARNISALQQSEKIEAVTPNDAITSASSGKADCAFVVTHPDSGIAGFADAEGGLRLVSFPVADMPKGLAHNAYLPVSIAGSRFKSLAKSAWVDGFAVETILIVNEAWQKDHLPAFDNLLLALQGVRSKMEGYR